MGERDKSLEKDLSVLITEEIRQLPTGRFFIEIFEEYADKPTLKAAKDTGYPNNLIIMSLKAHLKDGGEDETMRLILAKNTDKKELELSLPNGFIKLNLPKTGEIYGPIFKSGVGTDLRSKGLEHTLRIALDFAERLQKEGW